MLVRELVSQKKKKKREGKITYQSPIPNSTKVRALWHVYYQNGNSNVCLNINNIIKFNSVNLKWTDIILRILR